MAHISNPHVIHRRHHLTNSFSGFDSRGYDPINLHDFDQKTESFSGLEGTLKSRSRVFQQDVDQGSGYFSGIGSEGYGRVKSSMKDRSKDIMSVVGALLFGMGCGALTAATMYLVWSLFAPNRFEFEESDDEEFDGEDDDELYNPKKMGRKLMTLADIRAGPCLHRTTQRFELYLHIAPNTLLSQLVHMELHAGWEASLRYLDFLDVGCPLVLAIVVDLSFMWCLSLDACTIILLLIYIAFRPI
ncbi:hypothetical protein Leryth_019039 [Lithospermum erythrorhizon]|nr:hypothetical protein Leryth_019039 [Lithospermum erythrorhizon]